MLLRVVISPDNIRRLDISEDLESLEQLKGILTERLQLEGDFLIQFEDPDFGNELCNLTDIRELPPERAVLKILKSFIPTESPASTSTFSGLDSDSMSSPSTSAAQGSSVQLRRRESAENWPSPFPIPVFSFDVALRLSNGDALFKESGVLLTVPREMKMDILDNLAQAMFSYKAYPKTQEIESVAAALIEKHPSLADPGVGTGFHSWAMSIRYKLGNYRQKLRMAGCNEVRVNQRKNAEVTRCLKKARRCEVNFLPDNPEGQTDESQERERKLIQEEVLKRLPNKTLIESKMEATFSLRRKGIVEEEPPIADVLEKWPALFLEEQIYAEFFRITQVDLKKTFLTSLDAHASNLIKLYRTRSGTQGKDLKALLDNLDEQTTDVLAQRKATALRGLPLYLRENPGNVLKTCLDTDSEETSVAGVQLGIVTIVEDDVGRAHSMPRTVNIALVIEEKVVVDNISDISTAIVLLFGCIYNLNLDYPKGLKYTFEALQKIFMNLGTECSARVQALKNNLLK
ncbi:sterile alpha motif domain-containing protein 3-like isoform X1 [Limanda limanda]|uniref:sterile alpha motif domain-containing protein 3-like isoform X1 n=2 Tax=Limanda limanda TaxID=27771 RepID=UPI0029C85D6A|nr:sterile alpha motif domain-containing protein 3-like isoform X1 [Limanda limanda]XP_060942595.1 sterile alpha motif domain-containing protein 3-like isoform X1 [Limanda limanda]